MIASTQSDNEGSGQMDLDEVELGRRYACDFEGKQYFATVIDKDDQRVLVTLGDKINKDSDRGDPIDNGCDLGFPKTASHVLTDRTREVGSRLPCLYRGRVLINRV
jgi:hypothetical protein